MKCIIKNKDCINATPLGGCWTNESCKVVNGEQSIPKTAKERLIDELEQLKDKISKLELFKGSDIFNKLKQSAKDDLTEQYYTMQAYKMILERRLSNWEDI